MKHLFAWALVIIVVLLFTLTARQAFAATYQTGVYTNLCGTNTAATQDTCNQGCDPATGTCTAAGDNVVRFICDDQGSQCRNNMSDFGKSQSVKDVTCGKTVEIDVYKKKCQTIFGWFCNDSDKVDYMVWYSGNCTGSSPLPTPTITPTASASCDSFAITNGNGALVPTTVSYVAQTSGQVSSYRFYFGDGKFAETANPQVSHQYEASGTFTARAYIKDSRGNWITSPACETKTTVTGIALETQKSACANLHVINGNYTKAPTTLTFEVTGYDNKGAITQYKVDFGNGESQESTNNVFSYQYVKPGTYTARGYVLDTRNQWLTGTTCEQSIYATTETLTRQPGTGTPTWYTTLALASGIIGVSMLLSRPRSSPKIFKARRKTAR